MQPRAERHLRPQKAGTFLPRPSREVWPCDTSRLWPPELCGWMFLLFWATQAADVCEAVTGEDARTVPAALPRPEPFLRRREGAAQAGLQCAGARLPTFQRASPATSCPVRRCARRSFRRAWLRLLRSILNRRKQHFTSHILELSWGCRR